MLHHTSTGDLEEGDGMRVQSCITAAKKRWLNVSELETLLSPEKTPLPISTSKPCSPPQSGSLFLYDRSITSDYKDDGHEWMTRRNSSRIREDKVKLRVEGRFRFAGCYVYSAVTPSFHRRAYHLLETNSKKTIDSSSGNMNEGSSPNCSNNGARNRQEDSTSSDASGTNEHAFVLVHYLDKNTAANLPTAEITSKVSKLEPAELSPRKARVDDCKTSTSQALAVETEKKTLSSYPEGPQPLRNKEQLNMLQAQIYRQDIESAVLALSDNRISSNTDLFMESQKDNRRYKRFAKECEQHPRSAAASPFLIHKLPPEKPSFKRGKRNASEAEIDTVCNEPLPDIVNFSPDYTVIGGDVAAKTATMVMSLSAPLPSLSSDDEGFSWHIVAAFVDCRLSGQGGSPDLETQAVDLSIMNRLNLHTYKCVVPRNVESVGERRIVIAGVRLYSGTNPVCDGVSAGVAITLQAAWREAYYNKSLNKSVSSIPTFYSSRKPSGPGATANLRVLSQLSTDLFSFREVPHTVTPPQSLPAIKKKETSMSTSGDSEITSSELPAPLTTMAMIATVLPDFPNPPASAVIEPSALVRYTDKTKFDTHTHMSVLRDLPGTSTANAAVAEALELTVDPTKDNAIIQHNRNQPRSHTSSTLTGASVENDSKLMRDAALRWASAPAMNSQHENIGGEVDRCCKVCFVKKLTAVIAAIEEVAHSGVEDNEWNLSGTVPMSTSDFIAKDTYNHGTSSEYLPSISRKESTSEEIEYSKRDDDIPLADDAELSVMNEDKLDGVLDSLLISVVESLVEMGTLSYEIQEEINAPEKSGFTLLHFASLYNLQSFVPVLLSRGANPDTPTIRGKLTPLHLACGAGNWAIVELLVRKGCAVQVCDSFGSFPADHALRNGYPKIARWLQDTSGDDATQRIDHRATEVKRQSEFMKLNQ